MLNKNKIVRNLIYVLFCILVLIVGTALTYYIGFYDENIKDNQKKIFNQNEADLDYINCDEADEGFVFGSLFYKFSTAFLAGSLLSDKVFLKLGVI
jgi:uncharacterized membrane protein SpoIIM required for sporulation